MKPVVRDRILTHGAELTLETRVHLCSDAMGRFPHHIEVHLYSGGEFMGMMGYTAEDARRFAQALRCAATDLERGAASE
jgi:hypothetical protein